MVLVRILLVDLFVASIVRLVSRVTSVNCVSQPRRITLVSRFTSYRLKKKLEFRTVQVRLNLTYTPDFQNLSSNASLRIQSLINQTFTSALQTVTIGGFRPDLVSIV